MKKIYLTLIGMAYLIMSHAQFTLYFQGAEGTCQDNWNFTAITNAGGPIAPGIVTVLPRTGTRSIRAAGGNTTGCGGGANCIAGGGATTCPMHGNTITFNTVNISAYTGVQLTFYHRTHTACSGSGFDSGDNLNFEASLNGGPFTTVMSPAIAGSGDLVWGYTLVTYNVPAGTNTFAFRVRAAVNRSDEVFYIDDVKLTATGGVSSVTWNGSISTDWFCPGNWTPTIVPTSTIDAVFSTDNAVSQRDIVLTAGTIAECNNLSIIGGSQNDFALKGENGVTKVLRIYGNMTLNGVDGLDFSDGTTGTPDGTIEIKGNWDNQIGEAEFKQGESTVIFNGTGNQTITITGTSPEVFYNLQTNKASGNIILNDDVEAGGNSGDPLADRTGVLTLTNRNIITGTHYLYVVNPSVGAIAGGSSASFVDGNLRRQSNSVNLYNYPCGEGTVYMRAGLRTTNTSLTVMEVNAQNTGYGTYTPLEVSLFDVTHNKWWDVTKISGSSNVNVRLYWAGTAASNGITNVGDLVVAHWSSYNHGGTNTGSNQWWNRGRNVANSSALISDGFVEGSETESAFSPHTFGTLTNSNPLPIELVFFNVQCENGTVKMEWATASELNNAKFIIQGSKDAIEFHNLIETNGAGNSNSYLHYQTDIINSLRDIYFRLYQVDFDGTPTVYSPLYLDCKLYNSHLIISSNAGNIELIVPAEISRANIFMIDMNGKTCYNHITEHLEINSIIYIPIQGFYPPGIYLVGLIDELSGTSYIGKVIIQ